MKTMQWEVVERVTIWLLWDAVALVVALRTMAELEAEVERVDETWACAVDEGRA